MEVVPGLHWVERIWDTKVYVLFEDDRIVVIDAGTPGRAGAVGRYLESHGHSPAAVDEIWITHADIDHMGSVAAIKECSGAKVIAHKADAPMLEGQMDRELGATRLAGSLQPLFNWGVRHLFRYRPTAVDRLVEDGDTLRGWKVVHVPGHTPGSVAFHHPERGIVIVGDALNHRLGQLGAPPPLFTVDMAQARASVQRIAALDFKVCCFGHGPPLTKNAKQRVQALADSLVV